MPEDSPAPPLTDMAALPSDIVDLAIIGAGPVGLFGAFYAGLRKMSVKLIDSLAMPGGQLASLYPEKYIYDVAGYPKVMAKDLVRALVVQGTQFGARLCLSERVVRLESSDSGAERGFVIRTDRNGVATSHAAKAILIAAGIGAFEPKKLALASDKSHLHRHLHYHVRHTQDFDNRRLLIVGGGDSAMDWANALSASAGAVTVIHRSDRFRAHEQSVADYLEITKREGSKSKLLPFHELADLHGESALEAATVVDNRTGKMSRIPVDAVLVNIGFESGLGAIRDWGLTLEGSGVVVDSTMATSRAGIFAAGDICTYGGKLKLLATGFGEAATAVNHAKRYLSPGASLFPGHSTNMVK